jgi:hypothetical protein
MIFNERECRPLPPPIGGGSDDAPIANWMERAAAHQTRALAWLRQARDPSAGPLPAPQRRELLLRALENLMHARRLLDQARDAAGDGEMGAMLDAHLERLAATAVATERLLYELDAATCDG